MIHNKIILVLVILVTIIVTSSFFLLVHICPSDKLYDSILNQCVFGSTGWKITGYFTPLESDYVNDSLTSVYVRDTQDNMSYDYAENNSKYTLKKFPATFISEVNIQGSGKTVDDKILQTWTGNYIHPNGTKTRFYHYEPCARTSSGICLPFLSSSLDSPIVMVAVTKGKTDLNAGVIAHGTMFHISNIPYPWNAKTFWAVDVGEWHDKHVDVYTGYGLNARAEAERITKLPPEESGTVLIVGLKSINGTK
jgi:hypothetical protein